MEPGAGSGLQRVATRACGGFFLPIYGPLPAGVKVVPSEVLKRRHR